MQKIHIMSSIEGANPINYTLFSYIWRLYRISRIELRKIGLTARNGGYYRGLFTFFVLSKNCWCMADGTKAVILWVHLIDWPQLYTEIGST